MAGAAGKVSLLGEVMMTPNKRAVPVQLSEHRGNRGLLTVRVKAAEAAWRLRKASHRVRELEGDTADKYAGPPAPNAELYRALGGASAQPGRHRGETADGHRRVGVGVGDPVTHLAVRWHLRPEAQLCPAATPRA